MERMESFDTPDDATFDYIYKLLLVGNSGVGKTVFLTRYCDDSFFQSFVSTVGIDFRVKNIYRWDSKLCHELTYMVGLCGTGLLKLYYSLDTCENTYVISDFLLRWN